MKLYIIMNEDGVVRAMSESKKLAHEYYAPLRKRKEYSFLKIVKPHVINDLLQNYESLLIEDHEEGLMTRMEFEMIEFSKGERRDLLSSISKDLNKLKNSFILKEKHYDHIQKVEKIVKKLSKELEEEQVDIKEMRILAQMKKERGKY